MSCTDPRGPARVNSCLSSALITLQGGSLGLSCRRGQRSVNELADRRPCRRSECCLLLDVPSQVLESTRQAPRVSVSSRARFKGVNTDLSGVPAWKQHEKDNGSAEVQVHHMKSLEALKNCSAQAAVCRMCGLLISVLPQHQMLTLSLWADRHHHCPDWTAYTASTAAQEGLLHHQGSVPAAGKAKASFALPVQYQEVGKAAEANRDHHYCCAF